MNSKRFQVSTTLRYLAVIPLIAFGILSILATGSGGGGGGGGGDGGDGGGSGSTGTTSFVFGPGVSDEEEKLFRDAIPIARAFFLDNLGVTVKGDTTVFVFADLDLLVDAYMEYHNIDPSERPDIRKKWKGNTAEAHNGGMFINAGHPGWILSGIADPDERDTLRNKTLGHENFHFLQSELGVQGAIWLHEGSAEYVGWLVVVDQGLTTFSEAEAENIMVTLGECAPLSSLETREGFAATEGRGYGLGFLAVDFLPKPSGLQSLADFLRATGPGIPWQSAFQSAFGLAVSSFYDQFEAHRNENFPPPASC